VLLKVTSGVLRCITGYDVPGFSKELCAVICTAQKPKASWTAIDFLNLKSKALGSCASSHTKTRHNFEKRSSFEALTCSKGLSWHSPGMTKKSQNILSKNRRCLP
jgi:hypothetical protein